MRYRPLFITVTVGWHCRKVLLKTDIIKVPFPSLLLNLFRYLNTRQGSKTSLLIQDDKQQHNLQFLNYFVDVIQYTKNCLLCRIIFLFILRSPSLINLQRICWQEIPSFITRERPVIHVRSRKSCEIYTALGESFILKIYSKHSLHKQFDTKYWSSKVQRIRNFI